MSNQDTPEQKALRELRLWHWDKAQEAVAVADQRQAEGKRSAQFYWREQAEFHQAAVATLNAVVTGTAEEDAKL